MTYFGSNSYVSTDNSTSTPLDTGNTFTGTWEISNRNDMLVRALTDQSGVLYADFSYDGTNIDSTITWTVVANVPEVHRLVKGYSYFRIRFTNDSGSNQTFLRLAVMFGSFGPLTTPLDLPVAPDADTLVVRPTDFRLDLAQGRFTGESAVTKFGYNSAVAAAMEEDLWGVGGAYSGWLQTATTVRIKAGGSGNDTAAGTGAQSVLIEGLDENFAVASETVATAGASASAVTTTTFIRVFRARVVNVGTYHGANAAAITIENGSGGTDLALIEAGVGQTEMAIYTVPAGYTAFLRGVTFVSDASKVTEFRIYRNEDVDDVTTPFTGKRLISRFTGVANVVRHDFVEYVSLSEKTDVWVSAVGPAGGAACAAIFDLILVAT